MPSTSFDYYMVLPGVVAALSMGRLLKGPALSLQRLEVQSHPLHLIWAAILFVSQIISWHESASCRTSIDIGTSFWHYLAFLGFPTTIYLASTVLTPEEMPADADRLDLGAHYDRNAVQFFSICTVALIVAIITNTVFPCKDPGGWFSTENMFRFGGVAITLMLACISKFDLPHKHPLHFTLTIFSAVLVAVFAWKFW